MPISLFSHFLITVNLFVSCPDKKLNRVVVNETPLIRPLHLLGPFEVKDPKVLYSIF